MEAIMAKIELGDSILKTIKKLIGPSLDYDYFDNDLIIHINSAFSVLNQLGLGSDDTFSITGDTETWGDFLGDRKFLEMVKTYVYLKVKVIFDPPTSSFVLEAYNKQIAELEWRINVAVDPKYTSGDNTNG